MRCEAVCRIIRSTATRGWSCDSLCPTMLVTVDRCRGAWHRCPRDLLYVQSCTKVEQIRGTFEKARSTMRRISLLAVTLMTIALTSVSSQVSPARADLHCTEKTPVENMAKTECVSIKQLIEEEDTRISEAGEKETIERQTREKRSTRTPGTGNSGN